MGIATRIRSDRCSSNQMLSPAQMLEFSHRRRATISQIVLGVLLAACCNACGEGGESHAQESSALDSTVELERGTPSRQALTLSEIESSALSLGDRNQMLFAHPSQEGKSSRDSRSALKQDGETQEDDTPTPRVITETGVDDQEAESESAENESEEGRGAGGRSGARPNDDKPEEERPGIPVTSQLIRDRCAVCHTPGEDGLMSRISYMRKSPEGWELSLKRMIRLNNVVVTPEEARDIVRYLANDHGLARAEAAAAMYGSERRVHWSEEAYDKKMRESCAECHTLGRVLNERRDKKEWKLLKATHLAFFPLAQWQAFRGSRNREAIDWASLSANEASDLWEARQNQRGPDQADGVLDVLAKTQSLFTPEWEAWQVNRREVPMAGSWTVVGHEISRGDVRGVVEIQRVDDDSYETTWKLNYQDGRVVTRTGKALLYAGYSWRGRSNTTAPKEPPILREVLILNEDWDRMDGRIFTGEYHELGMDVSLHRRGAATEIFAIDDPAVMVPSEGHTLTVHGTGFPSELSASDFDLGQGVEVTAAKRNNAEEVELRVDVARDASSGERFLSYRSKRGPAEVVLYDTIDYIKITPGEGLARVGGEFRPAQMERFEAVGMNRGPDDESYTEDDFAVRVVPAQWSLEEFPIREDDDDVQFVGSLDPATGVFVPNLDGPNPERRWDANNIGDVYVVATCTLKVRKIEPPEKKPKKSTAKEGEESEETTQPPPTPAETPIVMEEREFRARGHLLVMVPLYVDWNKFEWDRR